MLQHADAAFPSGSFAFSNGVEGLAALQHPFTAIDLGNALAASIRHRWAGTDRVALVKAYRAGDDLDALGRIDAAVDAATLAEPLRIGSRRNGQSLLAAHARRQRRLVERELDDPAAASGRPRRRVRRFDRDRATDKKSPSECRAFPAWV
jgi:urease accessory protein UreF